MTTGVGSFKSYQLSEGRTTPVPNRVSPTDRIRAEIDALFDGSRELGEVIEDVARLGARLIIQTAVEAEVEVFLGRARYQRSAAAADARPGMRNGYCAATVKTTAGPVTVARPKLRGTTERFASALFGKSVTRSNALEALVIAGFVRGLSVRDVENTLADALGAEAALSKSAVSRICQAIGDEFAAWSGRRLDGLELDYLFLDASMFKMHPGARAEPREHVASVVADFHGRLGIESGRQSLEAKRWVDAASEVRDKVLETGAERVDVSRRLGNEALDRARSVQGRLSSGIAERALRRRGGEDEERDEQG
jgi:hypothetical protein